VAGHIAGTHAEQTRFGRYPTDPLPFPAALTSGRTRCRALHWPGTPDSARSPWESTSAGRRASLPTSSDAVSLEVTGVRKADLTTLLPATRHRPGQTHLQGFEPRENPYSQPPGVTQTVGADPLLGFHLLRVFSPPAMTGPITRSPLPYFESGERRNGRQICTSESQ
jgi:hypothetical protein